MSTGSDCSFPVATSAYDFPPLEDVCFAVLWKFLVAWADDGFFDNFAALQESSKGPCWSFWVEKTGTEKVGPAHVLDAFPIPGGRGGGGGTDGRTARFLRRWDAVSEGEGSAENLS